MKHFAVACMAGVLLCTGHLASAAQLPCPSADAQIAKLLPDEKAQARLSLEIQNQESKLSDPAWQPGYCAALAADLADKLKSQSEGVKFSEDVLLNTAVKYEAFRISAFRNAGVSPKRYFGYLDEQGKTAAYEKQLKDVAEKITPILNAQAAKNGLKIRITPKEIIVTHLAEGGALLLTDNFSKVEAIHPVYGIGLDDFRIGFIRFPGLMDEVDKAFGTNLTRLADPNGKPPSQTASVIGNAVSYLTGGQNLMTFKESILGTAVMYLYEKEIAEKKRLAKGLPSLSTLTLDEQYVQASLVYNSGILFEDARVRQMMAFDTGNYLVETSAKSASKRAPLPVILPQDADKLLASGAALPQQPTTWNAVYHVMQRYGAWLALSKFSGDFTADGELKSIKP